MPSRSRVLVVAVGLGVVVAAAPAPAAPRVTTWSMDEASGYGGTMYDSTGNIDGRIGSRIQRGVTAEGRRGYRWPAAGSDLADQDRLIDVGDRLDPYSGKVSIAVTFRTASSNVNLVQKGQSKTAGGFFKVDIAKGVAFCTFRGSAGQRAVNSVKVVNDQTWHTVVCQRDSTGVSITTDGRTRRSAGGTGSIGNGVALTVGGKKYCNQTTVGCDYFVGLMDSVKITTG